VAKEKESPKKLSRREFVKGAAAVAGAGALVSCAPAATPAPDCPPAAECAPCSVPGVPETWDKEADVVVVGYGGSGVVTAVTAHDAGSKVLILEKAPVQGGSTSMSHCGIMGTDNVAAAADYFYRVAWGTTPKDVCEAYAEGATQTKGWLDSMGIEYSEGSPGSGEYPLLADTDWKKSLSIPGECQVYWPQLDQLVKDREIEALLETPARRLVQHPETKEVLGVIAESGGKELAIKANKAVVLCCGGFEFNEEMKLNFLRAAPYHFYGWKYNTGDGITMAQEVGAALWHMNAVASRGCMWFPEYEIAFTVRTPKTNNFIFVDKYGRRYANEKARWMGHGWGYKLTDWDPDVPEFTRIPSFCIFDETARLAGPLGSLTTGICVIPEEVGGAPAWSEDNSAEIERGWIQKANTIEELAMAINDTTYVGYADARWSPLGDVTIPVEIDPTVLKASVDTYNRYTADGNDPDFARDSEALASIETPPYYAVALWPSGCNTHGGPKRDGKAQVVDHHDAPVPRLYSAGELGLVEGFLYEGAGAMGETVIFGRIAGSEAAGLEPWG